MRRFRLSFKSGGVGMGKAFLGIERMAEKALTLF